MKRLGYTKYVAQGGDWGAVVVGPDGCAGAPGLLGIHTNMAGVVPTEIDRLFRRRHRSGNALDSLPGDLSDEERRACEQLDFVWKHVAYAFQMGSRPQSLTGLADSPVGLAAFMLDHDAKSLELITRRSRVSPKACRETTSSTTSRSSG